MKPLLSPSAPLRCWPFVALLCLSGGCVESYEVTPTDPASEEDSGRSPLRLDAGPPTGPRTPCGGEAEVIVETSEFATLRLASDDGGVVALWAGFANGGLARRRPDGGWDEERAVDGGFLLDLVVDRSRTAWGTISDRIVTGSLDEVPGTILRSARPRLAATPGGDAFASWIIVDGARAGWGVLRGGELHELGTTRPGGRVREVMPAPADEDRGWLLLHRDGSGLEAVAYEGERAEPAVLLSSDIEGAGVRPFAALVHGTELLAIYSEGSLGLGSQRLTVATVGRGGVSVETLDVGPVVREAQLVEGMDGSLHAFWVSGELSGGMGMGEPAPARLRTARLSAGAWTTPETLASTVYDLMIPPFAAGVSGDGAPVVVYRTDEGVWVRRLGAGWSEPRQLSATSGAGHFDVVAGAGPRVFVGFGEFTSGSTRLVVHCVEE